MTEGMNIDNYLLWCEMGPMVHGIWSTCQLPIMSCQHKPWQPDFFRGEWIAHVRGFFKWGIPKSPWLSILSHGLMTGFGAPRILGKLHFNTSGISGVMLPFCCSWIELAALLGLLCAEQQTPFVSKDFMLFHIHPSVVNPILNTPGAVLSHPRSW